MKVLCRAVYEFASSWPDGAITLPPSNLLSGPVPADIRRWLDGLPEHAVISTPRPQDFGTAGLIAMWEEER